MNAQPDLWWRQTRSDHSVLLLLRREGAAPCHQLDYLQMVIPTITPLAYDLERLAPALAGDHGPNPEYPWPRAAPAYAPVSYEFAVWAQLTDSGRGRQLLRVIDAAVVEFPKYG